MGNAFNPFTISVVRDSDIVGYMPSDIIGHVSASKYVFMDGK